MKYTAHITVLPLNELLDPQGKAVLSGLANLGIDSVHDVRVGKHIVLQVDAADTKTAHQIATDAATKLLANPVMEQFSVQVLS